MQTETEQIKQEFEVDELEVGRKGLWGKQPIPRWNLQKERYVHRLCAFMLAEGRNHTDIAREIGVCSQTVNSWAAQSWMQELVLEMIHREGDETMKKLHDASVKAAETLVNVMNDAENKAETRLKAANDILDRKYGRPNQPHTSRTIPAEQLTDDDLARLVQN